MTPVFVGANLVFALTLPRQNACAYRAMTSIAPTVGLDLVLTEVCV
jgi:hypothetical protein